MRLAYGLAIALGLSFAAAGQTPAAPTPAETAPAAEKTAPESAGQKKPAADSTGTGSANADSANSGPTSAGSANNGSTNTGSANTGSPKTGSAHGTQKRRQRAATASDGAPRKVVVREGGASEPTAQIIAGMTPAEAARQRQNAEQWLSSTDGQLKKLAGRTLDAPQQETVGQIRNYMDGARSALQEGDVRRASTLAEKARLLAEDLAKH
jgi:hypothetical protein